MFEIRNESGILICEINERTAARIVLENDGVWKTVTYKDTTTARKYNIDVGFVLRSDNFGTVFIWAGYSLIDLRKQDANS